MLNVILYQPEIPPNTGNLIRLCANSGATLHLIEPLGFSMDTKALRRAGLDYHESAQVRRWATLEDCWAALAGAQIWAATTRGSVPHTEPRYRAGDILMFGPESRGLPADVLADARVSARIRIPMRAASRSLNLSNAVSIVLYEAWRQLGFEGAAS